jgi:hypothetical protein
MAALPALERAVNKGSANGVFWSALRKLLHVHHECVPRSLSVSPDTLAQCRAFMGGHARQLLGQQMNNSVVQTEPSYSPSYNYNYGWDSMDGMSYCNPGRDADDFHWLGHREGEAVPKWQRGRSSSF